MNRQGRSGTRNEYNLVMETLETAEQISAPAASPAERARLWTVLATIAVSIVTVVSLQNQPWSDGRAAEALTAVNSAIFLGSIFARRDAALARLLLFGLCFGAVELIADALCVKYTGTLDYSETHSAMLWLSPWWMLLAWMIVGTQIGYLGALWIERFGLLLGSGLTALLGAVNIPFYEEMAYRAHWWRYRNCKMLGHAPYFVIVAELLIGLALGPLARIALRDESWTRAAWMGALCGLSTILGGLAGYGLVERIL
jgi:hypothetical protein